MKYEIVFQQKGSPPDVHMAIAMMGWEKNFHTDNGACRLYRVFAMETTNLRHAKL